MSKNGQLRDDELVTVQGTIRLAVGSAPAWGALVDAVRAETGIVLKITSPRGGYRDLAMQKAAAGTGNHQYKPGTSVHGYGRCVDIYNWAAVGTSKLDELATRHGFTRTIAHEPWHYQHDGKANPMSLTPDTTFEVRDPKKWSTKKGLATLAQFFTGVDYRTARTEEQLNEIVAKMSTIAAPKIDPATLAKALQEPAVAQAIAAAVVSAVAKRWRE